MLFMVWFVFILDSSTSSQTVNLTTLRLVSVITRHGSRSPLTTYKCDRYPSYDPEYWPEGVGQLTRYGKRQMYATGVELRRRYSGYLSPFYSKEELSVTSNPTDRDMMSAQCLAAGLYPPIEFELWNSNIDWQPIPVYEEPFDVSKVVDYPNFCPRGQILAHSIEKKFDHDTKQRFQTVYDFLEKFSGSRISRAKRAQDFYEIFQLRLENGFPLPAWSLEVFPEPLTTISVQRSQAHVGGSLDLLQLTAGPLFDKIVNQFVTKIRGENKKKIYVQAGHDDTLLAILTGLGVANISYPGTSSYVVFELHEISSEFFVEVMFFKSCIVTTPIILDLPNCVRPCPLDSFIRLANELIPNDWLKQCEL